MADTFPDTVHALVSYAMHMRVPLIVAIVLIGLPFIAFFTAARPLLAGLFDVTPRGMLGVTLAAMASAETVAATARLIWVRSHDRLGGVPPPHVAVPHLWFWVTLIAALPLLAACYRHSARQPNRSVLKLRAYLALGVLLALGFGFAVRFSGPDWMARFSRPAHNAVVHLRDVIVLDGYITPTDRALGPTETDPVIQDHLLASLAMMLTLGLYAVLGVYGRRQLGRARTVPALCSALMIVMLTCWSLSAASFFTEFYGVPVLLVVIVAGIITAQSARSDHFYELVDPVEGVEAPDSAKVIATAGERVIVVAANGGGIQASAWTAQVLEGLFENCGDAFRRSLRYISSVSGGSVGTAYFVNWLAGSAGLRRPAEASALSSLDEVAWGLAWPDLLKGALPWVFRFKIGRGRALENAWVMNAKEEESDATSLGNPLSSWSEQVAAGRLPAVTFNATLTETGERLLLSTTCFQSKKQGRARVDGSDLHPGRDLNIVTAARLSATFPYVTPASRSKLSGPRPHVVDGGYYDNYGMATLVEWLDDALSSPANKVKEVLVIQIHGAKLPNADELAVRRNSSARGWFYQAFAPISTMVNVRGAGQVAHNDVEFAFLREKWEESGVTVRTVTFEFPKEEAPLSWHLTALDQAAIADAWEKDGKVQQARADVEAFLGGGSAARTAAP